MKYNNYDRELLSKELAAGAHREFVGGLWDEIGELQFEFMKSKGLMPGMKLLDIGCGCLRGGIWFIRYLDTGNYYGVDINKSLLDAAWNIELPNATLSEKVPKTNLLLEPRFNFKNFNIIFDRAIALSLFTHLPLNHIRLCLMMLAQSMKTGGEFYASFFECNEKEDFSKPITHEPGGIVTYTENDPYHYLQRDMEYCAAGLPWETEYIGNWGHPRGQKMMCYRRV